MANLYGFFGDKVYRMSSKTKTEPKLIDSFNSTTYIRENISDRSITDCIKINMFDFYKDETNEVLYANLLNFLKLGKVTGIDTLYFSVKIALDYQITDSNGGIIDAGVRIIQVDLDEVNVLLDPDPMTNTLSYRKSEYLNKKFVINRIGGSTYGVMDSIPKGINFKVNGITIYGNLTDMGSAYYIQNLGPSAQDKTFAYGSGTLNSIMAHSVILFDSRSHNINLPSHNMNYIPDTIYVSVEALMNQFCYVGDDTEIWEIIERNGGNTSNAPSDFNCPPHGGSIFDPIVSRPPCPGNYPMPPARPPHHRPGQSGPGNHPGHKPPINPPSSSKPIVPGGGWNPDNSIVPNPDTNQDHGDMNLEEWCYCAPYETSVVKYLVVDDNISDEEFDATSMAKFSDVKPYVTDIKVGDYVKKSVVLYY